MRKWVRVNLGIKFLSLFTAILLWFHVRTERIYENTVTAPIQYINLGKDLLLTKPPPESVKVKIRGKGKELLRFGKNAKVVLDLAGTELGWKRIDLKEEDVDLPPEAKIAVVSAPTPKNFVIRVEKKAQKMVKVIPNLKSSYVFEVTPKLIEIVGGRLAISSISKITTEEIIPPDKLPATLKVKLLVPEDIKASVDSVTVILKSPQE